MKNIIISAAAAVLALAACAAPAAAAYHAPPAHRPARCIRVAVGFPSATGPEADAPVTICGIPGSRRGYQCEVVAGRFGLPVERWDCVRNP